MCSSDLLLRDHIGDGLSDDDEAEGLDTPVAEMPRSLVTVSLPASKATIASRLSLTPEYFSRVLRELERPLLSLTLAATRGNQIRAAQLLGLNRNTLRKKLRELDIQVVRGIK